MAKPQIAALAPVLTPKTFLHAWAVLPAMADGLFADMDYIDPIGVKQIGTLLSDLGLPDSICHVHGFWNVHHGRLNDILCVAEKIYQRKRIACAPRTLTDPDEPVRALNQLWNEIKRRFNSAMNPQLRVPKSRKKPDWHWKVEKPCGLMSCRNLFIPKQPGHLYCSLVCRGAVKKAYRAKFQKRPDITKTCEICLSPFTTAITTKKVCGPDCKKLAKVILHQNAWKRWVERMKNKIVQLPIVKDSANEKRQSL